MHRIRYGTEYKSSSGINYGHRRHLTEHLTPLTPEQMEEYLLITQEGKSAHDVIRMFHEWLLASTHPEPLEDAEASKRNDYSEHEQTYDPTTFHPCTIDPRTILQMPFTGKKRTTVAKRSMQSNAVRARVIATKIVLKDPKKGLNCHLRELYKLHCWKTHCLACL